MDVQVAEDMSNFRVNTKMVFTRDSANKHKKGDTAKIVEFDKDGDPVIFADSWNRTFSHYRKIFEDVQVVSEDEYEKLRAKVFRVGCKVVFINAVKSSGLIKGDTGKIVEFDKDGDPLIFLDAQNRNNQFYRKIFSEITQE